MTDLHRTLQDHYAGPHGQTEVDVDGWRIDCVADGVIYEIQTTRLRVLRPKLEALLPRWPVVLVHPVVVEKQLVRLDVETGEVLSQRRSPKRGRLAQVFGELVGLTDLLASPNLAVEVVLCRAREVRDSRGRPHRWRRRVGPKMVERHLSEVLGTERAACGADLLAWAQVAPGERFTTADLAARLAVPIELARQVAYVLAGAGAAQRVGRQGRLVVYESAIADSKIATLG